MARWRGVLVAVGVSMLAACSGGGESTPATTSVVAAAPSSSDPPATTGVPSSTAAPTTTVDPAEALAVAVEADLFEANRLENEASQDPFNAAKEAAALDRRTGFAAEALVAKLERYRQRNLALRENEKVTPAVTIERPATLVADSSDVAEIQVCEVNSWILVEVGAGPNGSDAVVNSDVVASRGKVFLRNIDGVWRVEGGSQIGEWDGVSECPPE